MTRIPVYQLEGKEWWRKSMSTLRKQARGPEQLPLIVQSMEDKYFLPCPYCKLTTCSQSPVKPGTKDTEEGASVVYARFAPPIYGPARVILTPCEEAAYLALKARLGYASQEKPVPVVREQPKPVLSARETAEKILAVCLEKKGRTIDRLCEVAGIDVSDVVHRVLEFLSEHGKIVQVMGNRWILG